VPPSNHASPLRRAADRLYARILVVSDRSKGAQLAVDIAITLAALCGAELHLLMVDALPWLPATITEVDAAKSSSTVVSPS